MGPKRENYTGPSWRDAYVALERLEGEFGGGFVVQLCSAATLGTGRERGLYVNLVWRLWRDGRVVDWRYKGAIWKAQEHGSVPALICDLAQEFSLKLTMEGFAKQPPAQSPSDLLYHDNSKEEQS